MKANKKRLLCVVMALAVILSCVAIPNKADAASKISYSSLSIKEGRTPGISTDTYYLEGTINCGVDHMNIILYRKQDNNFERYRFDTIDIKTKNTTNFATSPVYSPVISTVLSENMWGDYVANFEIVDNTGNKYTVARAYTIKKNLGSYMAGLYKNFLMRDPDIKGYCDNMQMVSRRQITIEGMVRGFYYGPEYQGKRFKPTDEVFVRSLYRGILGREPDQKGFDDHLRALRNGTSRSSLVNGFLGSQEFKNTVVRDFKLDYHE